MESVAGKLQSLLPDMLLVSLVYLVAVGALIVAYMHAGRIWLLRHGVVSNGSDGHRNVWPGEFGELVIVTFALLAAWVVMFFTNDTTLIGTLGKWPVGAGLFLVFVSVWVFLHARLEVSRAREAGRKPVYWRRLERTYRIYNIYSICLFGVGAMIVMMLIAQFLHDGGVFAAEANHITGAFEAARQEALTGGDPGAYARALAMAEQGFSGIALSGKALQNQFNPLFVFAGTLILINIGINLTSLKSMFTGGAVSMTAIFTYGPLVVIVAIGLLVYLNHYEVMLSQSLVSLQAFTPPAGFGDWEMSQRHGEMVTQLSNARNIFGFATTVAGEGGGFAILAWGIQTALEKIGENDTPEAVQPPIRKFRPSDGRLPTDPRQRAARRAAKADRPLSAWKRFKIACAVWRRSPAERAEIERALQVLKDRTP